MGAALGDDCRRDHDHMRVIHVVPAITNEASGPSYSVVRLCESLIAEGQEVELAALDWEPMSSTPPFLKTFPLGLGPRRLGRSPAMLRWLRSQALSGSVSVLHSHGMWQMNAVYPSWVAAECAITLVVSPRGALSQWAMQNGSWVKRLFWPIIQRPAFDSITCFHATAEAEFWDIRRLGFRQPVAIVPNGIDIPELSEAKSSAVRTLLFLGRLHAKKGLDMLLPVWRAIQENFPDWQLRIVGGDDGYHGSSGYLALLRTQAAVLGVKRVEFVGELHGREKLRAYQSADLFVLPTYSENFGMTVAESLASGTPAIVTKGAPWQGLETHDAGWWIEIGEKPLTDCLQTALSLDSDSLSAMGRRGRQWMKDEFSWDRVGASMADTYRWLLDRGSSRPAWIRLD